MNTHNRVGKRWSVNEILALQREFQLLEWSIDQIAEKHQRTPNGIMFKLDQEGFADYNVLYSNYYNLKLSESKSKMKKAASLIRSNLWFSPPKGAKTLVKFISNNAISTTLLCHNISEKSKEQPKVSQGDIKYLNRSDMSSESSFNTISQMQNTKFLPDQYIESNSFDDDDSRKLIQLDKIPKSYATALQYDGFEGGVENFGAEELSVLSRVRTNSTSKEPGSQGSTRSI